MNDPVDCPQNQEIWPPPPTFELRSAGFPVVLSAPSGAGKTSICHGVIHELENVSYSVSLTTRASRTGEVDGHDYHFVTRDVFQRRVDAGRLIEWAEVHGNLYGTDREVIQATMARGGVELLDLDVQGGAKLKAAIPSTVLVFILPPSWEALEHRLRQRGDVADDVMKLRLANARAEMSKHTTYDYLVLNDDLDRAIERVSGIIRSESARISRSRLLGL